MADKNKIPLVVVSAELTARRARANVIDLSSLAPESISVTELEPADGKYIGKIINFDRSISEYPLVKWWRQRLARVPASIPHVFSYLREARQRNVCLIRGAPANLERQPTRRQNASILGGEDRGDHGFLDEPTRLFFLDGDKIPIDWRADPERAIKRIVAGLGELWAGTSFCWFLTASHGLEIAGSKKQKRWTGKLVDGAMSVRLAFITDRPLNAAEALELTRIAQARIPQFDASISRRVQPNYIKRPHWVRHPDRDVLGNIPTIGWVRGNNEYLVVPDNLALQARVAKAEGRNSDMAEHPDAQSAVRGIGSDGRLRQHLKSAIWHLLRANPVPDVVSHLDHAIGIANKLASMIEQYHDEIEGNLERHARRWDEVQHYTTTMADWAWWLLDRPELLRASKKTIKFSREEFVRGGAAAARRGLCPRQARDRGLLRR